MDVALWTSAHIVPFYDDDAFLIETVASFVASGLADGTAAIVIATTAHLDGIEERRAAVRVACARSAK